jgi:hypothetical protein
MSFADDIKKFAEKTNNTIDEVVISFVLDISRNVIVGDGGSCPGTPVDTGWAINNWVATIGTPNSSVPNQADKLAQTALTGVAFMALSAPGKVYYLTNNVVYINRLEYGYSKQAPRGMARLGVMAAKKEMMRKVRRGYGSVR